MKNGVGSPDTSAYYEVPEEAPGAKAEAAEVAPGALGA